MDNFREAESDPVKSIMPPYLLEEMPIRNPQNKSFRETLDKMQSESFRSQFGPLQIDPSQQNANGEREVYDAKTLMVQPGEKARFEGDPPNGRQEVDNAYDFTGEVRNYYKQVHGRNSIDDKGMKMISTVNYGLVFENAFWNGKQMTYGRPSPNGFMETMVLLDVAGHEITHGVTESINGLDYWGQAGSINEHLSDVFGELIQQRARNQKANDSNWIIGDGIWKVWVKGKGLRDMLNPGTAYDDPSLGKDPQPAHLRDYVKTHIDSGGVHYNSGIPNRAFALFSKDVGGYAYDKPGKIWYDAANHISRTPSFAQFAYETIESAKRLGHSDLIPKLEKSWSEVGITPSATETDTLTPPKRPGFPVHINAGFESLRK